MKNYNYIIYFLYLAIFSLSLSEGFSQTDSSFLSKTYEFSVDDILNQVNKTDKDENKISTVSSRNDSYFEVPLGASVVTKEMIRDAGCITLPEALRLMPGVLVREITPGNFDVRIRGLNGIPPAQDFVNNNESMVLVMIDNRPVFNYFAGGTFWETLPIDINDVERIELVRGPSAALYGLNAVNGVIHFITQKATENGMFTRSNLSFGNLGNLVINTSIGYKFNEKLDVDFSGNLAQRQRFQEEFYSLASQQYTSNLAGVVGYQTQDAMGQAREAYAFPQRDKSLKRFAFNGNINFRPVNKWQMGIRYGIQESEAIYLITENTYTPLSTSISESQYISFQSKLAGSNLQISHLFGEQEPGRGFLGGAYNFGLFDVNFDYDFKFGNFYLKPVINYRKATFDDANAGVDADFIAGNRILNGKAEINDLGLGISADYQWKALRLVAALRQDKLNVQANPFYNYQVAITYQIKQKHLIRASYGTAYRSLFALDVFTNYVDQTLTPSPFPNVFYQFAVKGNRDLSPPNVNSAELGFRTKLSSKWNLDIEFFYAQGKDFLTRLIVPTPISQTLIQLSFNTQNDALSTSQKGSTVSVEYTGEKSRFRGFFNMQWTDIQDFTPFDLVNEKDKTYNLKNYKAIPNWYGGMYWNYNFSSKWALNLNTYFFGKHELWHRSDRPVLQAEYSQGNFVQSGVGAEIKTKFLFNCKLMYSPVKQFTTFINIRNLLNQSKFEYYYTDKIGFSIWGGIHFKL